MLLYCSPSNPTGAVYPREQVEAIGRWAVEHGIWVVADEIYEHLTYDGAEAVSMPVAVPELADTCIVVNGVAKTYAMTGLAGGLDDQPRRRDQGGGQPAVAPVRNVNNIAQYAALAAVSGDLDAVDEMRTAFDRRRRTMVKMLSEIEGVTCPSRSARSTSSPRSRA